MAAKSRMPCFFQQYFGEACSKEEMRSLRDCQRDISQHMVSIIGSRDTRKMPANEAELIAARTGNLNTNFGKLSRLTYEKNPYIGS